jgi:ATP-binding cassette subfamily B protein
MACTSASSIAIPVLLGRLVDSAQQGMEAGRPTAALYGMALWFLGLIASAYLLREALNVLRRFLVTDTCTRINRDMSLRLVSHLMKVPLTSVGHEKVGALHGRVVRSVDGLVRFLRINFLDFLPAIFTGGLALIATVTKEPLLGLVMIAVVPVSVVLTVKQLLSQKGVRLQLMRNVEEIDGTIVEQLTGIEYLRASNMHEHEMARLADATSKRRKLEVRHHLQMSLFGCAKALNEGLFHVLVLALAIHLAILGRITFGEVLTFSILFLNVMSPLGEIHRVIDEGHESALQMGDLIAMLSEPVDASFDSRISPVPPLVAAQPAIDVFGMCVA